MPKYLYLVCYNFTGRNGIESFSSEQIKTDCEITESQAAEIIRNKYDFENVEVLFMLGCTCADRITKPSVFEQITKNPETLTKFVSQTLELDEHQENAFFRALSARTEVV